MKYIDEKRLRVGYLVLLALAAVLLLGAMWDERYNGGRMLNLYVAGLVGDLFAGLLFLVFTELLLKDALRLEPAMPTLAAARPDTGSARSPMRPTNDGPPSWASDSTPAVGTLHGRLLDQRRLASRDASSTAQVKDATMAPARAETSPGEPSDWPWAPRPQIVRPEAPSRTVNTASEGSMPASPANADSRKPRP